MEQRVLLALGGRWARSTPTRLEEVDVPAEGDLTVVAFACQWLEARFRRTKGLRSRESSDWTSLSNRGGCPIVILLSALW